MEEPKSYSIEKLNESNYRSWSQVVESHLDDQDLWNVVKGIEVQPEALTIEAGTAESTAIAIADFNTRLEAWIRKAKKARRLIISTISPSIMVYIEGRKDPAEMWRILEERYKPKTRVTLRQLQHQFNTIKMTDDDGDMEKHLQKVEGLKRQIEEQGEKISDSSYISVLLNCAPSRYDIQISILEAQDDTTPAIIINRLLEEYRKFLATKNDKIMTALLTYGKGKKGKDKKKFQGKCNHCNKRGHKEDQCWIKHPELKPQKDGEARTEKAKFSMMATINLKRQSDPSIWYTDSGASDHFSPFKQLFKTFQYLEEPTVIETAEGKVTGTAIGTIVVTVVGEDNASTELHLNNVIYAPDMSCNLFSLMAVYDLGYETRMTPGYGIRILHDGTIVAQTTREQGGLFYLKMAASQQAKAATQVTSIPELDINIWHRRLGHLNEDYIRKLTSMVDGMNVKARTTVGICEACLEGKQHRQPSHKPATKAQNPLELIHSDLCGPINPTSYGGANYYLLFVDDCTKMTHIYSLKTKTSKEVLMRFKEYKAEVENQKNRRIKQLRTDGGGEYEKWMGSHLRGSGIIHETTAPYSPEQNGIAERANRTIMERVRSVISEGKLDKRLWMELAMTVVYLKNRSPTTAVSTTPYEAWYGIRPDLSHLRILGSTAYVHIPKERRTKLDIHSHKGILVGYGGTNQYRVWDFTRNDVVVSRDVRFNEGIPASETTAIPIAEGPRISTIIATIEAPKTIHDSITVLSGPPDGSLESELEISAGDSNDNSGEQMDPQILLQDTEAERRSSSRRNKGIFTSTKFSDENFSKKCSSHAKTARIINPDNEDEPTTIQEAVNHPTHGKQWERAIREEYNSLIKNHTWELVPRPTKRQIITNKWILKYKRNEIGRIIRLKARLVARGLVRFMEWIISTPMLQLSNWHPSES